MKAKLLLGFCILFQLHLSAQNKDYKGLINCPGPVEKFGYIPYTGPTGPPENYKPKDAKPVSSRSTKKAIDSLIIEDVIPAGTNYTIRYDPTSNNFIKISPNDELTTDAIAAINASPQWMKEDLYDNFRRLDTSLQKEYAQLIISSAEHIRDEVAFQVAHLSTNMTLPEIDKSVLAVNAQGIYQIAPDLKYVKLVEHGSVSNKDWYTTTSYRIIDGMGDTVWREIPRDIYYWWVLMPTVYEETPSMDSTAKNEFWRSHVYNHADSGYPVLKNVLKDISIFWDGKNYHWDNRDTAGNPYPFASSMSAVQVLGRWVAQTITEDAIPPRPVQPNLTLYDHNGNCGEIEQMQCSGGRAALFPLIPVCTWPGDHIWNELYWPDSADTRWAFYQIARVGGPTDINWTQTWPGSACITSMRADGYRWMVNENYNPVCTVTVVVKDSYRKPVDGAQVTFVASPSSDPHSYTQSMIGSWGHTDENGELTVQLATGINYFIRGDWENGHYPTTPGIFYALLYNTFSAGDHKWITLEDGLNSAEDKQFSLQPTPPVSDQSIGVEYEVPYKITYGGSYWNYPSLWEDDFIYAHKSGGGTITGIITDSANNYRYNFDTEYGALVYNEPSAVGQMALNLSGQDDYYINLSNMSKVNVAQFAKIKTYLYKEVEEPNAIPDIENANGNIAVFPNPSTGIYYLQNSIEMKDELNIEVYNSLGGLVYQSVLNTGKNKILDLSAFAKGVYLLRVENNSSITQRKLVLE